jgi:hypothetical protein
MINILLVGAGQIGSRHLQALALLNSEATIDVIDPSENSQKIAKTRFEEIKNPNQAIILNFYTSSTQIQAYYDVVLITTDARPRLKILEDLVQKTKIKYLVLEKFLFIKLADYAIAESIIKKHRITTFVNTARRTYDHYLALSEIFKGSTHLHFRVSGSNWGLGCNGIHFVDLFAMLTQSTNLKLQTHLIDDEILESKRNSYIEFTGTLTGYDDRQNSLEISSYSSGNAPVQVEISNQTHRVIIRESANNYAISSSETNWQSQEVSFKPKFQSELTNQVVEDLIKTDTCQLTNYTESSHLHQLFLKAFLDFYNERLTEKTDICPIT